MQPRICLPAAEARQWGFGRCCRTVVIQFRRQQESVEVVSVRGLPDYEEYRDTDPPSGPPPWEEAGRVFVVGVPLAGIELRLVASTKAAYGRYDGGHVSSKLIDGREPEALQAALRAVELVVLSHALNGIDVRAPGYVAGPSTAVLGLSERFG